jgi:hypothetical protein
VQEESIPGEIDFLYSAAAYQLLIVAPLDPSQPWPVLATITAAQRQRLASTMRKKNVSRAYTHVEGGTYPVLKHHVHVSSGDGLSPGVLDKLSSWYSVIGYVV